jgi:hypothetical protein
MTMNIDGFTTDKGIAIREQIEKLKPDITILSETNESFNTKMLSGLGRPLIISGKGSTYDGVACVTQATNYSKISPLSNRVIFISLKSNIGIIGCYGPTEQDNIKDKHKFWNEVSECIQKEKDKHEAIILIGDFNAGHEPIEANKISGQRNYILLQTMISKAGMEILETPPTWIGNLSKSKGNEVPLRTLDRCMILCKTDYEAHPTVTWDHTIADHATLSCNIHFNELSRDTGRPRHKTTYMDGINLIWKEIKQHLRKITAHAVLKKDALSEFWRAKKLIEAFEAEQLVITDQENRPLDNQTAANEIAKYLKTLWGYITKTNTQSTINTPSPTHQTTLNASATPFTPAIITSTPPTIKEITTAIANLKPDTAMGRDRISANSIKDNPKAADWYKEILDEIWKTGTVPQEWKDMKVKALPKKSTTTTPNQTRPITCLSTSTKVLNSIIKSRGKSKYNSLLHNSQHAYREGRSTFSAIKEAITAMKSQEKGLVAFLDMSKAFDSIPRSKIQQTLQKWGIAQFEQHIIMEQYNNCQVYVEHNQETAEPFLHEKGVKQGCTLSSLIFNLIMAEIHRKFDNIAAIGKTTMISYSDDIILIAENELSIRVRMRQLKELLLDINLQLNESKTEFLHFDIHNRRYTTKTWLGVTISSNLNWTDEAQNRIQKAKEAHDIITKIKNKRKLFLPQKAAETIVNTLIATHLTGGEDFIIFEEKDRDSFKNVIQRALITHARIPEEEALRKAQSTIDNMKETDNFILTEEIKATRKTTTAEAIQNHNTCQLCTPPKLLTKIDRHREEVHKQPPLPKIAITCEICNESFTLTAYQKHFCKPKETTDATCLFCGKGFKSASLHKHVVWCCENPERITGRTVKCPICLEQISTRGFDRHKQQCTDSKEISTTTTCPLCNKEFKNRGFNNHYNSCKKKPHTTTQHSQPTITQDNQLNEPTTTTQDSQLNQPTTTTQDSNTATRLDNFFKPL